MNINQVCCELKESRGEPTRANATAIKERTAIASVDCKVNKDILVVFVTNRLTKDS